MSSSLHQDIVTTGIWTYWFRRSVSRVKVVHEVVWIGSTEEYVQTDGRHGTGELGTLTERLRLELTRDETLDLLTDLLIEQ